MSWWRKLFGRVVKPKSQEKARTSVNASAAPNIDQRSRRRRKARTSVNPSAAPKLRCNNCGAVQREGDWEKAMDTRARAIGRRGFVNLSAPEECLKCGSTDLVDDSLPKRQSKEPSREVSDLGAQFAHAGKEWENAYSLGLREAQEGIMTHYHSTEATKKKMEKQIERLIAEARTKGVLDDVLHLLQRKGEKAALYVIDHYL